MSKQVINLGTTPSDGSGDNLRSALGKVNHNFDEVYAGLEQAASADELDAHVEDMNNPHGVTKSQVGLGNVDNTSDANKPISTATQDALNAEATTRADADSANADAIAEETAARIAADALKADLVDGMVPTAQIPAIAIMEFLGTAANQAAMLAFTGQSGDWCNRSDVSKAYVLIAAPASDINNWAAIDYPAAPVLSVNGQAGTVVLSKSDVGLSNVTNTSDANKPVSTAQQTALNLKQDASTLGASWATATHAATAKVSAQDADEFGMWDAGIGGFKKLTWANLKAFLKPYFDTVYPALAHKTRHQSGGADAIALDALAAPTTGSTTLDATATTHGLMPHASVVKLADIASGANNYTLPPPTGITLGGVKNNAGTAGQFVTGIDSGGALTYDTPAGGGGGALVRGSGTLTGNTDGGHGSAAPADLYMYWIGSSFATFTLTLNGVDYQFTLSDSNPGNGSIWVDASFNSPPTVAANFAAAISALAVDGIAATSGTDYILITNSLAASSAQTSMSTDSPSSYAVSGGGTGLDTVGPFGAVTEVEIIPQSGSKAILPVRIALSSDGSLSGGVSVEIAIKVGSDYFRLAEMISGATTSGEVLPGSYLSEWLSPRAGGSLVARYSDSPPFGGVLTVWVLAEQN